MVNLERIYVVFLTRAFRVFSEGLFKFTGILSVVVF